MDVCNEGLKTELTVVVPAHDEVRGILVFLDQLHAVLSECCTDFEVIVVDDGSRDGTWQLLCDAATHSLWLRGLRFTRNFGKEAAILGGLRHSRGQAVIVMDADGQHPPELVPVLLEQWRSGSAQIVAAQKKSGAITLTSRINTYLFNKTMHLFTGLDLKNATDYRLLDRTVVDTLLAFPENVRFFRGMTVWTGFTTKQVEFEVANRIAGSSRWSTGQLTRLAITAITAYSAKPLGIVFWLGIAGMVIALLLIVQALYSRLTGIAVSGWTSLTIVILVFGSANLLGIGVLGAYLAQIFDEIKGRPEYILKDTTFV
ncbi:glycosyltransferase family 2 protein [Geobacter sp. FeAm09]|uniref:glycosyltransferase family 2 protein n=1 Tax=Geobacter sp. FeAm09 TaxID=2597769 RepID=UPI0011EF2CC6|nr:glycosyltransferase family 2 protein [Geobacter sp. FeAm09]QEM68931.1 glycosyltransferase family 2 protein [Geobacter sp. FeAm09]